MGNTIRREPISTRIPASPDYKYLNITDFRGISQSDNPFILDYKTASDSLNVYVDESNTLTTRPRLEKILDRSWTTNISKFYGLYPLSIGYLLHCQISGTTNIMYIVYKVNGGYSHASIDNPDDIAFGDSKILVFEQDDAIYVITNKQYCRISYMLTDSEVTNVVVRKAEPYVPTTKIGEVEYEKPNILTNKYKELLFWDGESDPNGKKNDPDDILVNKYVESKQNIMDRVVIKPIRNTLTETNIGSLDSVSFLCVNGDAGLVKITTKNNTTIRTEYDRPSNMPIKDKVWGDCSDDGAVVVMATVELGTPVVYGDSVQVYRENTKKWYVLGSETQTEIWWGNYDVDSQSHLKCNADGSVIVYVSTAPDDWTEALLRIFVYDANDDLYKEYRVALPQAVVGSDEFRLDFSPDGNTLSFLTEDWTGKTTACGVIKNIKTRTHYSQDNGFDLTLPLNLKSARQTISNTDLLLTGYVDSEFHAFLLEHASDDPVLQPYTVFEHWLEGASKILLSEDNAFLYAVGPQIYRISRDQQFVVSMGEYNKTTDRYIQGTATSKYLCLISSAKYSSSASTLSRHYLNLSSTEPLLEITRTGDHANPELLTTAAFTFRFDENRWFANGAYIVRTTYNDPTYIPETHVALLGETDEIITGHNIVQDDLCVVYKDNRLYSISPHTYTDVSGTEIQDYVYRETKNTVGNNAMGAAIVSAYTEQPLQITYDGVYALKQLTNVYASDRISESISDDIAAKWLKESRDSIRNAKTINRLYWTYFTLTEKDKSKVYLLDNRTTSWFYWEFPIVIKNIFVKNNAVELTDADGNFYQLTTKDIYRNYKTEYYDDGKRIIPWYWKSQILPLGTMNYSKKLIDTTFIFTDTEDNDAYGLTYTFNAYRKVVSKTNETTITNNLSYVQSTTKKTLIPRCNFIQLELSNVADSFDHNKLRLVGLGLKYVLLEGLL